MRIRSGDVPTTESRRIMGLIRNQITANTYRVTIDNATVTGSTFEETAIPRGTRVPIIWHPERNFWEIEFIPEENEYLTFMSFSDDFGFEGLATVEVTPAGIGPKVYGPESNGGQYAQLIAISANGSYMAAVLEDEPGEVGLFAWDASAKGWSATPIDTVTWDFISGVAMSVNGDLLITGEDSGSYIIVYPTSIAGFGAAYSAPGSGLPENPTLNGDWHPSGNGLLVGVDNGFAVRGWQFTTGVGFGAAYAPYDPGDSLLFNGTSEGESIRFSPSGDFVLVGTDAPKVPDVALFYEVWNFDVVTGWGSRVPDPDPFPTEEQYGDSAAEQFSAISNTHIYTVADVTATSGEVGLWTYPYDAGGIGAGVLSSPPNTVLGFNEHAVLLSRTGKYLAFWAENAMLPGDVDGYMVLVYSVATDGSLTELGYVSTNFSSGRGAALGWR